MRYRLVNAATGSYLGEISDSALKMCLKAAIKEKDDEYGVYYPDKGCFFLGDNELKALSECGLEQGLIDILKQNIDKETGGLNLGWAPIPEMPTHNVRGRILGVSSREPLPGLKVEVHRSGWLSEKPMGWVFSGEDGKFDLRFSPDKPETAKYHLMIHDPLSGKDLLEIPLARPLLPSVIVQDQFVSEPLPPGLEAEEPPDSVFPLKP